MTTYLDLIEKWVIEADTLDKMAKALGVDRKKASDDLALMPVSDAIDIMSSAEHEDEAGVFLRMDNSEDNDQDEDENILSEDSFDGLGDLPPNPNIPGNPPLNNPNAPNAIANSTTANSTVNGGQTDNNVVAQAMANNSQVFNKMNYQANVNNPNNDNGSQPTKPAGTVTKPKGSTGTVQQQQQMNEKQNLSIGDKVIVNGKKGYIAQYGPNNTVGVNVDGAMDYYKETAVKLDEAVLGFSTTPDLRRVQELAGIVPTFVSDDDEMDYIPDFSDDEEEHVVNSKQIILDALKAIEDALPGLSINEYQDPEIQKRLLKITNSVVEQKLGRKIKL